LTTYKPFATASFLNNTSFYVQYSDMKIYLLRHGQSEYNTSNLINTDPKIKVPLTKLGVKQAEKAGEKLKKIKFDAIYVSDFLRAKQTAEIVNKYRGLKLNVDLRLNEVDLGFEGKTDKEFLKAAGNDYFHFRGTGTENWQDLKVRVQKFLDDLKRKNLESVLVVSHQWVAMVANQIVNGLTDKEAYDVQLKNCGLIVLEI
jgi:broad specificity phosphatase PhoE